MSGRGDTHLIWIGKGLIENIGVAAFLNFLLTVYIATYESDKQIPLFEYGLQIIRWLLYRKNSQIK